MMNVDITFCFLCDVKGDVIQTVQVGSGMLLCAVQVISGR